MSKKGKGDKSSTSSSPKGSSSMPPKEPMKSSSGNQSKKRKKTKGEVASGDGCFSQKNIAIAVGVFAVLIFAVVMPLNSWLKAHFTSPLGEPKVIDTYMTDQPSYRERLWGSYRSNVYFGFRPRITKSLIAGLVWVKQGSSPQSPVDVRHTCEHSDGMNTFGWTKHDGATFGQQRIIDGGVMLSTDFIVNSDPSSDSDSWTARIKAQGGSNRPVSLIFYFYSERQKETLSFMADNLSKHLEGISGDFEKIGKFDVKFSASSSSGSVTYGYLVTRLPKIVQFSQFLKHLFQKGATRLPGEVYLEDMEQTPNLVAYQVTARLPLDLEVVFTSGEEGKALSTTGERFESVLKERATEFDKRFESVFPLKSKGFDNDQIMFAKAAFSNLIGGISYFYGSSYVSNEHTVLKPMRYFSTPLHTAVPSRSFFPRGFLWDEGFHQLIVSRYDMDIAKDVLGHWLDLMNANGWIPREQILGDEALSKVPSEFVIQHHTNANPPTLFLTFDTLLDQMEKQNKLDIPFLNRAYPRLKKWFNWFAESQVGPKPLSFRWRGRNSTTDRELNPKTLTSGLDDYPRASHPSDEEYHIDLRCWMVLALKVLCRVSEYIKVDEPLLRKHLEQLTNSSVLDKLHWDNSRKMYSDFGNHTSNVKLVINRDVQPSIKVRKVKAKPKPSFVNSFGYVNLFPLLMNLIPADSPNLEATLTHIRNESLIWSKYGLRSLAMSDPFYSKSNTEHDQPYWRGAVWININYLTIKALHHYANIDGPYKSKSLKLYEELRSNIINNMYKEYKRTGYIWEQYSDKSGIGKGTHPFTGWSSLVVLIMAEQY